MAKKKNDDDIDLDALASGDTEKADESDLSPVYPFKIDIVDGRKKRWQGDFVFHVPTLGDQIKIARMKALLLPQGGVADPGGAISAEMMAYCHVTFATKPKWWKPERFYDPAPLLAAYGEARRYEARFLGAAVPDNRDDASEDGGQQRGDDRGDVE